jgi:FMN-binding domain
MKRAPLLVLAGTVAGFIGVLGFHTRSAAPTLPGPGANGGNPGGTPAATRSAIPAAGQGAIRSALGPSEQFGYGVLDVKVTVSGTRITHVSVPTLRVAEFTSHQICDQAIPLLTSEVLSTQSASIDGVSGATFTSEAYAQSLQAALDALHVK